MSDQLSFSLSIPMSILTDKKLSSTDKLVYAMICGLSKKNGACWASNAYISSQLDLKKDTVSRVISKLVEIGYVKRKEFRNENKEVVKRLLSSIHALSNVLPDFNAIPLLEENDNPIGEFSNTSPGKIQVYIEDYIKEEIKDTNTMAKKSKLMPPSLEEVKLYFREKGYREDVAIKAFEYYSSNDWKDKNDSPVKNWRLKMHVWFKDSARIQNEVFKVRDTFGSIHFKTQEEINKAEKGFFNKI
jgi:DNA-binding MarR family transcriptional regulator